VRLHLFALKDEDAKEGTPSNRMPSYVAMMEMATKDPETRRQIGSEKISQLKSEFSEMAEADMEPDDYAPDAYTYDDSKSVTENITPMTPGGIPEAGQPLDAEPVNDDWLTSLDVDGKGNIRSTIENVVLILQNDPLLKGKLALNTFSHREVLRGNVPWRKVKGVEDMIDRDDAGLRYYLEKAYDISSAPKISDALAYVVEKNAFHPIKEYLDSLVWDGVERCETLFIDYLGVSDTPYARAVTRKVLAAAVNRVFVPGCKFDYAVVLVGNQGCGKSTLVKKLGRQWFSDSFTTVIGKEAYEQLQGKWILEMAELSGLKKAEINAVKHFISKQEDSFRVAYGKRTENFPRQSIFIGTINEPDFLQDPTGNRRFWPLDTGEKGTATKSVFDDLTLREVNQIWAEAVCLFKAGEPLFLEKEVEDEANEQQKAHSEVDDRAGIVREYLNTAITDDWRKKEPYERRSYYLDEAQRGKGTVQRNRASVAEIWVELFRKDTHDMNKFNTKSIHNIMRNFPDWEYSKFPIYIPFYGRQRAYFRSINMDLSIHEGESDAKTGIHEIVNRKALGEFEDFN
jgi:predicted P-loop ATPase